MSTGGGEGSGGDGEDLHTDAAASDDDALASGGGDGSGNDNDVADDTEDLGEERIRPGVDEPLIVWKEGLFLEIFRVVSSVIEDVAPDERLDCDAICNTPYPVLLLSLSLAVELCRDKRLSATPAVSSLVSPSVRPLLLKDAASDELLSDENEDLLELAAL